MTWTPESHCAIVHLQGNGGVTEQGEASMAYADNNGIRIHYQVEGDGPPLVLQHGYSDSLESWYEFGYVDKLKSQCQLILIDARGHGASDKPHDTAPIYQGIASF